MKTNLFSFSKKHLAAAALAGALFAGGNATAQTKVYANTYATSHANGVGSASISSASSAIIATGTTPTTSTLQGHSTLSITGLLSNAVEYLQFPSAVPAGTPIYIKFTAPSGLLGLNVGGLLGNLAVGTFTGTITNAATNANPSGQTDAATNSGGTSSGLVTLLSGVGPDEIGIVNNSQSVTGVYVKLSALLAAGSSVDLYHAYYYGSGTVGCPMPIDYVDGTGAVAGLANLATGLLSSFTNPANAIDGNTATATTVSVTSVANTAYYTAILNTQARTGDSIRVMLNNPNPGLIDLSVLSSDFTIEALNGDTVKYTVPLGNTSLVNLQLLPGSNSINVIKAAIPGNFDRIKLSFGGSVADVSALLGNGTINLYEMATTVAAPVISPSAANQYTYVGNATTLKATSNAAGDPIVWIDSASSSVVSDGGIPSTKPAGNYTYYALSSRDGCTDHSDTAKLVLHVVTAPTNTPISGSVGQPYSSDVKITTNPTDLPNTPHYVYSLASGTVFNFAHSMNAAYAMLNNRSFTFGPAAPEMTSSALDVTGLPPGLTLNSDGTITGTPTTAGDYDFTVHVVDDANQDASGNNLIVGDFDKTISIQAALPIQLQSGSFKATLDNYKNVVLSWATSSEINSSKFNIQRSSDNQNFTTVGTVKAKGNSSTGQTYSFTDKTAAGLAYYKLQEVDADNAVGYTSGVISIDNGKQNNLLISPNPATTYINISGNTAGSVKIYDAAGRLVLTGQGAQIDVRSLASGVYYIVIRQDNGTTVKRSFIKK